MKVIDQLCIESFEVTAENGDYFKAEQGKVYTTTVPKDTSDMITLFSRYLVKVPKKNFVIYEKSLLNS
jgi:hypothetical protein